MQYVGVGLLTGGASVLTAVITTIMVNARHLFYSISMIGKYRDAGAYKPYFIFALTDETYSLLCDDDVSCVTVVMVTGTGRSYALGYNLVLRYLEAGDIVIATVRRPSSDIDSLKEKYGERLIVATMDLLDSESVNRAAKEVAEKVDHIDTLINNAVGVSPDCDKGFLKQISTLSLEL